MIHRFIRKPQRIKYVKRRKYVEQRCKIQVAEEIKPSTEEVVEETFNEENKEVKDTQEMAANKENLAQVEELLNDIKTNKVPKRKPKVIKKNEGLIERTENDRIILTEDNKMLLND